MVWRPNNNKGRGLAERVGPAAGDGWVPAGTPPTRFIIVDQGLRHLGGHHAEYTLSVASEAAKRVSVTILAHARCEITESPGIRILPTFRFEWTQAQRARATADYDPAISFTPWLFLANLREGLAAATASHEDHVFVHSIGFDEIEDILTLVMTADRLDLPTFHILLRRDLDEISGSPARRDRFAVYLRAFASLAYWPDLVRFYTDTEQLSGDYARETGVPFSTLPIPFDENALEAALHTRTLQQRPSQPVIVGYLGDARPEKGYQFLPTVAKALLGTYLSCGKARLRLQSSFYFPGGELGMSGARRVLEEFGPNAVELLYEPMPQEEYYRQLADMDIVVLPYIADRYRRRSSGIFAQAVAAGKIVIVPRGTTMWAEAKRLGIKSCIPYDMPSELPNVIADAIERYSTLRDLGCVESKRWQARGATTTLVETLLCSRPNFGEKVVSAFKGPVILHIINGLNSFDDPDIAQRVALRTSVFQRMGCRVLILVVLRSCLPRTDLSAWLVRIYQHWVMTGATFSWVLYFTQPEGNLPISLETDILNSELLSIPETLPHIITELGIDLVWMDSVRNVPLLDLLGLSDQVPTLCECDELRSFQHALQRGTPVELEELEQEISLLRRMHAVLPIGIAVDLFIADASQAGHSVSAFHRRPVHDRTHAKTSTAPSITDLLYVMGSDDWAYEACNWFCEHVYGPYLLPHGVTLSLASSSSVTHTRCGINGAFGKRQWIETRIVTPGQAYASAKIVILPIAGCADLTEKGGRLVADAVELPPLVKLSRDPKVFAAQLMEYLGKAWPGGQIVKGDSGDCRGRQANYVDIVACRIEPFLPVKTR